VRRQQNCKTPSLFKKIIYKERNQDRYSASDCCRNLFERKDEQLRQMYQCIQKLEETNKMIILMTLDGLEYQEISEVMG
jgi:DNA-directed RNA polymerase specialized sigma24 family protein